MSQYGTHALKKVVRFHLPGFECLYTIVKIKGFYTVSSQPKQECCKDLIQYLTLMSPMIYDVIDSNVQANIDFAYCNHLLRFYIIGLTQRKNVW